MSRESHIIHRVNLEIEAPDRKTGNRVQEEAVLLLKNEILPGLEKYLDSLHLDDNFIRMDRLDLDISMIKREDFENELTGHVLGAFSEKIEKLISPRPSENDSEVLNFTGEQLAFESFLFFLEKGRLPWWSNSTAGLKADQNPVLSRENIDRIFILLKNSETGLNRLLLQYPRPFILQIISSFLFYKTGNEKDEITGIISELLKQYEKYYQPQSLEYKDFEHSFLRIIIHKLISGEEHMTRELIRKIFEELQVITFPGKSEIAGLTVMAEAKIPVTLTSSSDKWKSEPAEEGIFVQNAGLVLLHPFLEYYFLDFELVKDGKFRNSEDQTIAVHLLHFLATGQEMAPEYDLLLEKFLCGWDLDLPIAREVTLSIEMKTEGEKLLKAVIGHWSALKKTSPDGLREGFLQREGKLVLSEFQHRLVIENKAQDVLLSYLPWGFSVIKLPWMESALYVDWQQSA